MPIASALTVAKQLGLGTPLTLSSLIHALLHPEQQEKVIVASAGPSTVAGSCEIRLKRSGTISYKGHIHESGAISHRYMFITAIPVLLLDEFPAGTDVILVTRSGHVNGTLAIGSRDDEWDEERQDPVLSKHWLVIDPLSARTNISVSTGDIDVLEAALGFGFISFGVGSNPLLVMEF